MTKTYKVRRLDYTNREFEVMALADLHAAIKAKIEAGNDPEEEVSYVCIKHEGNYYWGVDAVGHGTNAELRNGLDVEMWWDADWTESADDDGDCAWLDDYKTI